MTRHRTGAARPRDPRSFTHPLAYRSRTVAKLPVWLWLVLGAIVAAVLLGLPTDQQSRQRDVDRLADSEPVDAIRVSRHVAGFADDDGQAHLARVRRLPRWRAGRWGGSTEVALPTWSVLHATVDDEGAAHAFWTDEVRLLPSWAIPVSYVAGSLAVAAVVVGLVGEARRLRRLRRRGVGRTEANIALLLDPMAGPAERDPRTRIERVLNDRSLTPLLEPWTAPGDDDAAAPDEPPVADVRPSGWLWFVSVVAIGFAGIMFGAVVQGFGGPRELAIMVGLVALALATAVAIATPLRYRVVVSRDGVLTHRWLLGRRRYDLASLHQVIAWVWSAERPHGPDQQRRMAPAGLALRFRDGRHLFMRTGFLRDTRPLGEAVRYWASRSGAELTGDTAYALRFTDDPRDEPASPLRCVADDRWLRRPARQLRTRIGSVVFGMAFLLAGVPVLATIPIAHLLWDNPDEGDPRPALLDPCTGFHTIDADDVEPLGEVSADLFSTCGGRVDGEWIRARTSPSAAAYGDVLTHPRDDIRYAEVVDEDLREELGALQLHVLAGDDDVWLMARTRAGTIQVAGERVSEPLLSVLAEQLRADNVRPIDSDVEIVEQYNTLLRWMREAPQAHGIEHVEAAVAGTFLEGRIAVGGD